jgi:hypothetical protein
MLLARTDIPRLVETIAVPQSTFTKLLEKTSDELPETVTEEPSFVSMAIELAPVWTLSPGKIAVACPMGLPLTLTVPDPLSIAEVASAITIEAGNAATNTQARNFTQDSRTLVLPVEWVD